MRLCVVALLIAAIGQGRVGELIDTDGEYGSVSFNADRPGDRAGLDRPICTALARLEQGKPVSVDDGSLAVEALAHEAYHLAGVRDESSTQCYALRAMRFVAQRLGVSGDVADAYVAAAVTRYPSLPDAYRSFECRDGGALDMHPESGIFP